MSSKRVYVPPHRRHNREENKGNGSGWVNIKKNYTPGRVKEDEDADDVKFLMDAFAQIYCINLQRRPDRWKTFLNRLHSSLGEKGSAFVSKVQKFEAIDGAEVFRSKSDYGIDDDQDMPCLDWDATKNALYDRHVQPPMAKRMTPGEVGCAMSHVKLWRRLLSEQDDPESTMLILEDDAEFYKSRGRKKAGHHSGKTSYADKFSGSSRTQCDFFKAFQSFWTKVPSNWDIIYLGFSDRGERLQVETSEQCRRPPVEIHVFRPTYGFHTHAYALKKSAAYTLLSNLPVTGPLDVWLADNDWFGLNVYGGVVAGEGWNGEGAWLIPQRKHDTTSDIQQSGH